MKEVDQAEKLAGKFREILTDKLIEKLPDVIDATIYWAEKGSEGHLKILVELMKLQERQKADISKGDQNGVEKRSVRKPAR